MSHLPNTQVYEVFIRTTPEKLWAALTLGERTRQYFFGTEVSSSLQPGAPIVYTFADGTRAVEGKILEAQAPRSLVHTWKALYDPQQAQEVSQVSWQVEARGSACKLTATHDLTHAPHTAANVAREGWSVVLSGLKTLLETDEPLAIEPGAQA